MFSAKVKKQMILLALIIVYLICVYFLRTYSLIDNTMTAVLGVIFLGAITWTRRLFDGKSSQDEAQEPK